ncbi:MAG: right-handed parallel beta-helix repeat-containing protein, partial [Phycisphaeraceae bacterium]
LRHGEHGLRVHGGTEGFEANDLHISRSGDHGVQIALGSDGVALSGLTIRNVGGHGIDAAADNLLVSGADIRGAEETGINLTGMNGTVQSSTIAANETGIEAFGDGGHLIGSEDLDAGLGNIIFENANGGISAADSLVAGNHVHSHLGYTPAIRLYSDGRATLNVVHHNRTGIQATSSRTTVDHNRVYANIDVGIRGGGNTNIHHNVVYSNDYGIRAVGSSSFSGGVSGDIAHNIIYDNASAGLFLDNTDTGDPTPVFNNTFYELEGRAVHLGSDGAGVALRNNVFVTDTGTAIYLQSGSETGLTSDHNLFDVRGSGAVGFWQGSARNDYLAWRNASFQDANSIAAAPLFVSVSADPSQIGYLDEQQDGRDDDFHLRSQKGSYHGGTLTPVVDAATGLPVQLDATLTMDAEHSPAINRGDDSDDNSNEPTPNGGYINLGAYGNSEQASQSLDAYLLLMRPDGGESWPQEQTFTIDWRSHDTASNISIELLDDQANVVHTIADNIADAGSHDWTVSDAVDTGQYVLRVTRHDGSISVTTADVITITDPVTQYFVNDGSTGNDVYTSAIGDNANDGTSAATPMASIRAVIETYSLGAGDEILVDVGNYDVSNNVVLAAAESGIIIRGVYDPDDLAASTVLNRNSTASGSYVFEFDGASDVTIESLAIMGADSGIFADEFVGSTDVTISNVLFSGHGSSGISIDEDNDGWLIEASTFDGQNNNTKAIEAIAADNTVIRGNEMFGHNSRVVQVWASSSTSSFVNDTVTGTVIEQNTIYDNDADGISTRHHIEGTIRENTVNNNRQGIIARGD